MKLQGAGQREREIPSLWCFFPPDLHSFSHFSSTGIFAGRRRGERLFPDTVPLNSLALSPQCCYLNPLQAAELFTTASDGLSSRRFILSRWCVRWARTSGTSHLFFSARRRHKGAGLDAQGQWMIPCFSQARLFNPKALLALASSGLCSQLQVIICLMVPLPCLCYSSLPS